MAAERRALRAWRQQPLVVFPIPAAWMEGVRRAASWVAASPSLRRSPCSWVWRRGGRSDHPNQNRIQRPHPPLSERPVRGATSLDLTHFGFGWSGLFFIARHSYGNSLTNRSSGIGRRATVYNSGAVIFPL